MTEFQPFAKIGRLSRDILITEKIDGSNAQILIEELTEDNPATDKPYTVCGLRDDAGKSYVIYAGSRKCFVTPGKSTDNFGFAQWVSDNSSALMALGAGRHFGEWWGSGIQRKYGLSDKRFSLFNVRRWNAETPPPACCSVVPVLYRGNFDTAVIRDVMIDLRANGSTAAPGFMNPEGVVIYHTQSGILFKKTFEKDDAGKGREPEPDMAA